MTPPESRDLSSAGLLPQSLPIEIVEVEDIAPFHECLYAPKNSTTKAAYSTSPSRLFAFFPLLLQRDYGEMNAH
jgi:hypothetical protein